MFWEINELRNLSVLGWREAHDLVIIDGGDNSALEYVLKNVMTWPSNKNFAKYLYLSNPSGNVTSVGFIGQSYGPKVEER